MSDDETFWWGEIYFAVVDFEGVSLYREVLQPMLPQAKEIVQLLTPVRQLSKTPTDKDEKQYILWDLYALSRISDFLLLGAQSSSSNRWDGPSVTSEEYQKYFCELGFETLFARPGDPFSPFHHEVVHVEQSSDPEEAITVQNVEWFGLTYGEMLFSRCGVSVRGGAKYIDKVIAETSTLYFSYRRLTRRTEDLSLGWGSNSQWRTDFRRDYAAGGELIFNQDGESDFNTNPESIRLDGQTLEEHAELCMNRCFIKTNKTHVDLWPYNTRVSIPGKLR